MVGNSRAPRNATKGVGKFPPPLKKNKKVLDKHLKICYNKLVKNKKYKKERGR